MKSTVTHLFAYFLTLGVVLALAPVAQAQTFIGEAACIGCHANSDGDLVDEYVKSGHRYKLNRIDPLDPKAPTYPDGRLYHPLGWTGGCTCTRNSSRRKPIGAILPTSSVDMVGRPGSFVPMVGFIRTTPTLNKTCSTIVGSRTIWVKTRNTTSVVFSVTRPDPIRLVHGTVFLRTNSERLANLAFVAKAAMDQEVITRRVHSRILQYFLPIRVTFWL